ncbi:unnamed protein product [Trichogramma brassicae]|uniref:Uncharacterized protein n=1 Tax=Trichogramma brassicae TaxID=86971 RepID=A0A6H5J4C4_9HYME|nr:unnamed protein product [Trichogramma brassicae]
MKRTTQKRKAITPSPRKRGTNQSLLRVNNNSVAPNTPKNTPKRRRASQDQTPIAPVRIRRSTSEPSTSTGNTEREVRPEHPTVPPLERSSNGDNSQHRTAPPAEQAPEPQIGTPEPSAAEEMANQGRAPLDQWGRAPKRTDRHKTGDALIRRPRPRGPRRLPKKMRGILYTSPNRRGPKGTNTLQQALRGEARKWWAPFEFLDLPFEEFQRLVPCKVE